MPMGHTVELRYIGGDLAALMQDMRAWLDRNQIKAEQFQHSSAPPGLAFRIELSDRDQATAFAEAFGGWVDCADGQAVGRRWVISPRRETPTARNRELNPHSRKQEG